MCQGLVDLPALEQQPAEVPVIFRMMNSAGQKAEGQRESQQQAPSPPDRPSPARPARQRALQAEDPHHGQQNQRRAELHFIARAGAVVEAKSQNASREEQGDRRHEPAQNPAPVRRAATPGQRRGHRQPNQRYVGQDAKGMLQIPVACRPRVAP